ncbi:pre-mRNA cleavage complex 2 protein Pcf11 isoform X2 [Esox lucius]|uniref:Pre-mRNA cleavage complex 2 protein Pcf11 n=1 Tax=Esox lucius TaxID=8010 RepID=A0A3P8ZT74_ESOLU|nr:pre-mRNA cleavage complex 2 protein Pcf11 isoform X2 [Esox lucius]
MDCLVINGYVSDKIGLVFDRSDIAKMDDAAREDACREYQSSLEDLTFNSKPHINMLTILAEENLHFAKDIVAIIEAQITKAPAAEKLPVLYLVDSIVKNVGGEYLAVFAKNLVTSFICVFEKVDENTRKSLFKLRSTWDEIFPLKKLYALDVRVNSLDPAWPIKPLPPTVNASIHVNPRFLKHPEEVTSPRALSPPPVLSSPGPKTAVVPSISEKSITQEQVIRQQLLAKQKQLLELQQKKIELELEQTKAQLSCPSFIFQAANVVLSAPALVPKATPSSPVIKHWIPPVSDPKPPTRDPRLNRGGPGAPQVKESNSSKKDCMGTSVHIPEKQLPERPSKPEKTRPPKKEHLEVKAKSKSLSPMPKGVLGKSKHYEAENVKATLDATGKKDPRLRKHLHDKADPKEEEVKEKKKSADKEKERDEVAIKVSNKGKMVNGLVNKSEREKPELVEKPENQIKGNARTNARKRSRSRSRSPPQHLHSPKRKTERRSPKRRARSISPSPPSHKPGKGGRQSGGKHSSHSDDFAQHGTTREERVTPKKSLSEPRRAKRPAEERLVEARETHSSPRNPSEGKETKENKRWRSGWEENKHLKSSEEAYGKGAGPLLRRPSYSSSQRPSTPRTPKQHRLSVDANLQIPEALHSASKRDLLKKASKRLENGEISNDDFLNVAHQIKQLFQYQEEKLRGGGSREGSSEDGHGHLHHLLPTRKKPLLATPPGGVATGADLSDAELTYYEHKSKLRRTQVMLRQQGQEGEAWDGEDSQDEGEAGLEVPVEGPGGNSTGGSRGSTAPPSGIKFTRLPKEHPAPTAIIQEYSHGNEFPRLKSLPGLRFRRRQDPRETSATDRLKGERERNSPLSERLPNHRPPYADREEPKSGYDAHPRRYGVGPMLSEDNSVKPPYSRYDDPRTHDRKLPGGPSLRNSTSPGLDCPGRKSPVPLPVPVYERERLSPLQQLDSAEMSPAPCFESPTSEHSDDGPLASADVLLPPRQHHPGGPPRGPPPSSIHNDSPGHTPPHAPDGHQRYDSGPPSSRYDGLHTGPQAGYDGPGHMVKSSRPHRGVRYEGSQGPGRYNGPGGPSHGPSRYDDPHSQGPNSFDGPLLYKGPERFDGPGRFDGSSIPHVPMRGGDPQGIGGRFDGSPKPQQQGGPSGRYDGLIAQQPPGRFEGQPSGRFEGQGPGTLRFDGPMQSHRFDSMQPGPGRFEGAMRFQQGPMRFEGPPNQPGPMRFDGPVNPSAPLGQPGLMRFDPLPSQPPQGMPQHFDCPPGQQGSSMFHVPPQGMPPRFDCPPGQQGPPRYHATLNSPAPPRPLGTPMYDPANPGGLQQQASFKQPMIAPFQTFPGQQTVVGQQGANFSVPPGPQAGCNNPYVRPFPFTQPTPQFPPPESHFGQVDVNDLLSKLISTGIIPSGGIKATQSSDTVPAPSSTESEATPPAPTVIEEEEEEEQEEDENLPDLTGFVIDDMKQRYDSVVTKLYTGIQCYSCGMRFTASQTDVYADHLDWHYRLNRSEKDISKKVTHRRWYYSLMDWIEFEEIADLEERAKSLFFEKVNEEVVQKTQEAAKEKEFQSVKAAADVVDEACEICQEQFEMYWEEDEEEWHLKDAIRVDEKTYHPSCFEDYKNTSLFLDFTPSPNKLLTENPLSAFIKRETDDSAEITSCHIAVKKEVEALSAIEMADEAENVKEEVQVKTEGEMQ